MVATVQTKKNICVTVTLVILITYMEMKMSELIARLMAAIETPDDLTQDDVNCLLEDAHIVLQEDTSCD